MATPNSARAFDIGGNRTRFLGIPRKIVLPEIREPLSSHALFTERLPLIDEIVEAVSARCGFTEALKDDFRSDVHEKLLADDCARMRRFGGHSSWKTYLTVVITNLARDYRNKQWGKWRPSARAKQLGEHAVRLERLVYRDGLPLQTAIELLVSESSPEFGSRQAYELYAKLPMRRRREIVGLEPVADLTSADEADAKLWAQEDETHREKLKELLDHALEELSPEDRLIIRMRYFDGFTLARTAEALNLSPQRVHDRIKRILLKLREVLGGAGLGKEDAVGG